MLCMLVLGTWTVSRATTQSPLMLLPLAASYQLGGFYYEAPLLDGWRQVGLGPESLELVYAEQVPPDSINTRCYVTIRAFPVSDPGLVSDAESLAQVSLRQQLEKRRDRLIGYSPVRRVPGEADIYAFSIISKNTLASSGQDQEKQLTEVFWVNLAADKSEYLVLHLSSQEADVPTQIYFDHLYGSLASLRHSSSRQAPGAGDAASGSAAADAGSGVVGSSGSAAVGAVGSGPSGGLGEQ